MSATDVPDGQRRPSGEDLPQTRREMKERGISFTTELPVIDPADLVGAAAGAARADRTEHDRVDAGRAVTHGGPPTDEDGAEPGGEEEGAGERTAPARRPVVRAPLTASGIRTVDESGTITSVQSAVGRAVEAATSPASWASAVSMPAVALGIQDVPVGPSPGARPRGPAEAEDALDEEEPEPEHARTGPDEPAASTGEDARPAGAAEALQEPSPTPTPSLPEGAARSPQELAEESVAPTPVRRGSRTAAVVVGLVLVVLVVVVLLVTLLSGGARAADLPAGVHEGCVGTLAVAPAFLRRRVPLPAEPTEETCDR